MTTKSLLIKDQNPSSIALLVDIWGHCSRRRRIQLCLLPVVMLASGVAELVSLGAVLPFLGVLSEPELLWQRPLVQALAEQVGWSNASQLVVPAALAFAATAVLAALIRLANLWLNGRMAAAVGSDLSCEAYRRTLLQPYGVHVARNSASVINTITVQIGQTVGALNSMLQLLTSSVVAVGLLVGLLLIDAQVALVAAAIFSSAYVALAMLSRRELQINGRKITSASTLQIKSLQEGLGAIRDVLLNCSQNLYLETYRDADRPQRQLGAKNAFIIAFPRYSLEALGMVAIALLGGVLVVQRGSGTAVIPLLGALALGAQRMLPALQQVYAGWAALKSYNASMKGVLEILDLPVPLPLTGIEPLLPRNEILMHEVHFRYGRDQPDVLRGVDLEIRVGERIGLIGSTGSGKSTTVDILMGLLVPTTGKVLVDGVDLHDPQHPERLFAWRASIAHVPQSIYLADSSISENIAFGVPRHQIDFERVKQAAHQAQIANYIESTLEGYESFVGERGIRLSGGQRQRIGIARALYKQARVLVFDEATSALDNFTEEALMTSIEELSKELTIVIIAHRLTTVQKCDRIISLECGKVFKQGTPSNML